MQQLRMPLCETCGCPDAQMTGTGKCSDCPAGRVYFDPARGTTPFSGLAKKVVERLKYHGRVEYVPFMARHMFNVQLTQMLSEPVDLLVPVPLHSTRRRERGFNQSEELARQLTKYNGAAMSASALRRIRPTPSQTRLNRKDRAQNIAGAFASGSQSVQGLHCLLIDDVYTTGATLNECARILVEAGAVSVHCLAFARATLSR
jgi:ComF family protein